MSPRISQWWNSRPMRKLRRDRLAVACAAVIAAYAMVALLVTLGVVAADHDARVGDNYETPSLRSVTLWLGADRQGRSILMRALYSAKIAFGVGLVTAILGAAVGTLLGSIAGYFGKTLDDLIVYLYSTVQSIPYLILLIALTYVAGKGLTGIYIALGATAWVGPCRVVRGEVLKLREAEYVQSARAMGCGTWRILLRHILPNTFHLVLVYSALLFVGAIKSEVILSFLGLGVQGAPSWGVMINQARAELINGFYWQIGAATVAMFGLVLSFNVLADALQDALDPRARERVSAPARGPGVMADPLPDQPLLRVIDLETTFFTDEGEVRAVDKVTFDLHAGDTLGIVGESGCGKTVMSKSIMRLVPDPPGRITGGQILYRGEDLVTAGARRMQDIRGNRISMIFQEPMTALNPVFTIGWQIEEALLLHQPELGRKARRARALHMLESVGIPSPERRIDAYPHQLSGGMRQRAMIAVALSCNPDILIADEPTTALDVTIQAQVLRLLGQIKDDRATAIILNTHDLGVVAEVCDRVIVVYAAQIVEEAPIDDIFHRPAHPYTRALLRSIPRTGPRMAGALLPTIPGTVPDLRHLPSGCRFQDRCEHAQPLCAEVEPMLEPLDDHRRVRCHVPVREELSAHTD